MWVVRESQELGPPSPFLFRKHFSISGSTRNSARRTLACSRLFFYTGKKKHYWYFNISLGTYFSSTVIIGESKSRFVILTLHVIKKCLFKWRDQVVCWSRFRGNLWRAGNWRMSRSRKPLSISSVVLAFRLASQHTWCEKSNLLNGGINNKAAAIWAI